MASRRRLQALVWSSASWGEGQSLLQTVYSRCVSVWTVYAPTPRPSLPPTAGPSFRWGWQFSGSQGLDENLPFFGAFGPRLGRRHGRTLER